jgi:hypothetical protein
MFAASKTDGSSELPDPQFNYVTMLLHGDGTNGAQNNTFLDSSTNNFTITRNGNTTQGSFSPYGSNWSNYFGGSSDWLTLPSNAAWTLGSTFTIEAWVNPAVFSANAKRICQSDAGLDLSVGSTGLINFNAATTTTALSLNVWSHVAFVCNSGTSTLYINGVASGFTGTNTGVNVAGTSTLTVGTYQTNSGYAWQGYISNFRIVKSSAVYTSNFTPSTTPLTAITNTQLLTCQSNRFVDNSSNAFTVTAAGAPSVQRFNPFGTSTAYSTSVIGGSGYFDGTGDYLDTTLTSTLGTGNFTVECWFNNADLVNQPIFSIGSFASGIDVRISESAPSKLDVICYGSFKSATFTFSNAWQHLAIVRNSGTTTIYLNGSLFVAAFADTNNYLGNLLRIGGLQAGGATRSHFLGYISNFRITNTAVYTTTFTPSTTPLTAISGTQFLSNMTNGAIFDNAMMNDLETVGNAQISTSVVKYGTGSLYFDGSGDNLFAPTTPNLVLGTGDFTIEFWINLASNLVNFAKIIQMGTTGNAFTIETQSSTNVLTVTNFTSTVYFASSTALTNNTWIHVAVTRSSGTIRLFQNGIQTGSSVTTVDFLNTGGVYIGQSSLGTAMNGYLDDLRITKGYARYTANFTPPTAAFPNTGPY